MTAPHRLVNWISVALAIAILISFAQQTAPALLPTMAARWPELTELRGLHLAIKVLSFGIECR